MATRSKRKQFEIDNRKSIKETGKPLVKPIDLRMSNQRGNVKSEARDKGGNLIRTAEQQVEFEKRVGEFKDEDPRAQTPERRAEQEKLFFPQRVAAREAEEQRIATAPLPEAQEIPKTADITPSAATSQVSEKVFGETLTGTANAELLFRKIKRGDALSAEEQAQVETLGLNNLDFQVIRDGDADINGLSRIVEGLPVLKKLKIRAAGLTSFSIADFTGKSPSSKVTELLGSVDKNAGDIGESLDMYAKTGNPLWLQRVEKHKNEILRLESRIKLLSILSPEIQNDSDIAQEIQRRIEDAKSDYPTLEWFS